MEKPMTREKDENADQSKEREEDDELVVIEKFFSPIEAGVFKARLESYGIKAFLFHDISTVLPYTGSVAGSFAEVQIRKSDMEKARAILEQDDWPAGPAESGGGDEEN
jgi:hypothetical protein